ncbi:MAG: histidine--tRNA ligase [Candidatus Acidiferrales bacterium]
MQSAKQFRAIKGTRDILPPDSALWNWFERAARDVFESYNFREIRTPIFEETSLFARAVGAETDIVHKEMYTFGEQAGGELHEAQILVRNFQFTGNQSSDLKRFESCVADLLSKLDSFLASEGAPSGISRELLDHYRGLHADLKNKIVVVDLAQVMEEIPWVVDQLKILSSHLPMGSTISLRPEATASVVRAYIEHGMQTLPGNQKLYYMGPMFRRERPQKGRYRQFYQIGGEVLGPSDAPAIDAEVIEILLVFFQRVGLDRTTLYVNSIGCKKCRPNYVELLRGELRKVKDALGPDSQRRIETNPLRVLDSKLPEEQDIIARLPRISDHLCDACREHFTKLKEELKLRNVAYEENWRLVRGLDYYTRTTFEVTAEGLGSQNAVCGGGRYDGLVELLGGLPTKGIGFAVGSDRAILSIQEGGKLPQLQGLNVFVAWMGAKAYPAAVSITRRLRDAGLAVELPPEEMKFKKSLGLADKLGARYALILGEDEVASGTYTLKRLADAEQKKYSESELLEYLESERKGLQA